MVAKLYKALARAPKTKDLTAKAPLALYEQQLLPAGDDAADLALKLVEES